MRLTEACRIGLEDGKTTIRDCLVNVINNEARFFENSNDSLDGRYELFRDAVNFDIDMPAQKFVDRYTINASGKIVTAIPLSMDQAIDNKIQYANTAVYYNVDAQKLASDILDFMKTNDSTFYNSYRRQYQPEQMQEWQEDRLRNPDKLKFDCCRMMSHYCIGDVNFDTTRLQDIVANLFKQGENVIGVPNQQRTVQLGTQPKAVSYDNLVASDGTTSLSDMSKPTGGAAEQFHEVVSPQQMHEWDSRLENRFNKRGESFLMASDNRKWQVFNAMFEPKDRPPFTDSEWMSKRQYWLNNSKMLVRNNPELKAQQQKYSQRISAAKQAEAYAVDEPSMSEAEAQFI